MTAEGTTTETGARKRIETIYWAGVFIWAGFVFGADHLGLLPQIGEQLVAVLEQRFPGLAEQVEVIDVATPATFERYTGNWRGAWMGWVATPETMNKRVSKTLPGLKGFYMTGTWTLNGTLAFAAMSGRHVTQLLCAQDKKRFATSVP